MGLIYGLLADERVIDDAEAEKYFDEVDSLVLGKARNSNSSDADINVLHRMKSCDTLEEQDYSLSH